MLFAFKYQTSIFCHRVQQGKGIKDYREGCLSCGNEAHVGCQVCPSCGNEARIGCQVCLSCGNEAHIGCQVCLSCGNEARVGRHVCTTGFLFTLYSPLFTLYSLLFTPNYLLTTLSPHFLPIKTKCYAKINLSNQRR